jgi:hypothetical protein
MQFRDMNIILRVGKTKKHALYMFRKSWYF